MERTIIHVDMDAFYAAVEVRDDPKLRGKPLIIGALPHERGVVSTCSYEARKFGVRSAMSIKQAYRLCPDGVYMHPNPHKYKEASDRIHEIWASYTDAVEFISLDEGFLDVTGSQALFGGAEKIGSDIKKRTISKTGLTCSVGIGYSLMSAKLASEEKKPDGFFAIPDAETLKSLILDREVGIIYGIGVKTSETLKNNGINLVRDIISNPKAVIGLLGNHGRQIIELAEGIDCRRVTPYYKAEAKTIGREHTFQQDVTDENYLKDVLRLLAKELSLNISLKNLSARTITLKIKYSDMKQITRSKSGDIVFRAKDIYNIAASMLETVKKNPVRLIGITLGGFEQPELSQISFDDITQIKNREREELLDKALLDLSIKYGGGVIKTGNEILAEKHFERNEKIL